MPYGVCVRSVATECVCGVPRRSVTTECHGGVRPTSDQHASDPQEDTEDQMDTIASSIDIQRPVEAVFAYVADPRNDPQWVGAIKEAHVTPEGPPIVGTK